jgi:glycerol-3-phosphate dehydrogenase
LKHACRDELAMTVSDVMRRRTRLALSPFGGERTAQQVSQLMACELGWSELDRQASLRQYLQEWESNRAWHTDHS